MNQLMPRSRIFLVKLSVLQLVKGISSFYGTRRFIAMSQEPTISPQPGRNQCSPRFASYFLKINFNITFPNIRVGFKWQLYFRFPDQEPVCISHICLIHATRSDPPILLDIVTGTIFVESYEVRKSL